MSPSMSAASAAAMHASMACATLHPTALLLLLNVLTYYFEVLSEALVLVYDSGIQGRMDEYMQITQRSPFPGPWCPHQCLLPPQQRYVHC